MVKKNFVEHGIFKADVKSLKKRAGRCFIKLHIYDLDKDINIDIYDEICETMGGVSYLSSSFLKLLLNILPFEMEVSNFNGFWKIENLPQILSDTLIKTF